MKQNTANKISSKNRTILQILTAILIVLLLTAACIFGFALHKQNGLLKEREKELSESQKHLQAVSSSAVSYHKEKLDLEATLASCSSYLSEEDLTESEDLPKPSEDTAKNTTDNKNQDEKKQDEKTDKSSKASSYQTKYKNLYASKKNLNQKKIVHLTFDDGPSQNTPKVLDILDRYDIKATFFVVYNEEEPACNYYKEIVDRGHTLAIHTASHNYKQIYASVDAYLEDFNKIYTYVYEKTGVYPSLFRYPGGSTNCLSYDAGPAIMDEMERRGFIYYDWNVSSGDGGNQATRSSIYDWVTSKATKLDESVVLMHDSGGKGETVAALPSVIETLQEAGCVFEPLSYSDTPVQFQK